MRLNPIPVIAALFFLPCFARAQDSVSHKILLRSATLTPAPDISFDHIASVYKNAVNLDGRWMAIVQFESLPLPSERKRMEESGIFLESYIPHNAYSAIISGKPLPSVLLNFHIRALLPFTSSEKIDPLLFNKLTGAGTVWVSYAKAFPVELVKKSLAERNFDITDQRFEADGVLGLYISFRRLEELASLPFIEFVEKAPGPVEPLLAGFSQFGLTGGRGAVLNASIANGGKDLNGDGVTIGIGDNADPSPHPDFADRLISRAWGDWAFHGTHVIGIAGGAGNINDQRRGYASKSTLIAEMFNGIVDNAGTYVNDHGMVITNNSYGIQSTCESFGVYTLTSRLIDQKAFTYPNLINVFAASNSGGSTCAPFPTGFRTVYGDYQTAKNVLTVGNAQATGVIFGGSGKGPVRDGRIKPEVLAIGTEVTSTSFQFLWNYYANNTGTSMAAPAISGGLALLFEKYKAMYAGANPKNGLMKALVCNGADDWGNPGPDYTHGFGLANFWRSEQMLEKGHFLVNSIGTAAPDQTTTISVPAGTASLKVMLYWNDPAAAAATSQALVNDLDLVVEDPSAVPTLPLILDTVSTFVNNNAFNGADHINNIEQVVINNPASGNYTLRVKATAITQNSPQEYFLVYDFVPTETRLVAPFKGDAYFQGDSLIVQWDSYGDPVSTFNLEFSDNNGGSWTTINNNIPASKRQYYTTSPNQWWVVPAITTDQALVRISRNNGGMSATSGPFVIHDTIAVTLSPVQCEGYISMDWNTVPGATGYEVMMLRGKEMAVMASVSAATITYTFSGLSMDSTYWVTVRPLIGASNAKGRRAFAVSRKPDNGNCAAATYDLDIKMDSLLSRNFPGRLFTSTALPNNYNVQVRIKNLDDQVTPGNITVGYKINNGAPVTQVINPAISALGTYSYSFPSTEDLSAVGTYVLKVFVNQSGDPNPLNDTLTYTLRQLDNPAISGIIYPSFYIDNFDAAPVQTFNLRKVGLDGLDRYDFVNTDLLGRIRSFINSGLSYSGQRALTLDMTRYTGSVVADSLTGTFNLSGYDAATDDIRLDFRYKNHFQLNYAANRAWVRGSDTDPWIMVYDLYANQNPADGSYKFTDGIKISDSLLSHGQNFSSSFQVRWGQQGKYQAAGNSGGGYTFDDIRLYEITEDIKMVSIDTPIVNSCGLSSNTPIAITIRNTTSHNVAGTIPVRYRINGGSWVNENAPALNANTSAQYIFSATANLAATGIYTIQVEVNYPGDTYDFNDTLSLTIVHNPVYVVTNSSPYLQDFESSDGSWYSGGFNSSWEYGTPSSYKISRAASGIKAWKTRAVGNYNDAEDSYLYSPCFNISGLSSPKLSFSLALDLEDCGGTYCDGAYLEYSNDGRTWSRLGANGQGTNWYNKAYSNNNLWSVQNYHRWHVATIPLSVIPIPQAQLTQLRFRFVMHADGAVSRDGIAFDDFHIYGDPNGIYTNTDNPSVNQATVNGNSWINFISSGKLIASLNPSNNNMGSTDAQLFIYTGPVRVSSEQFYHNRNITVKPTTVNLPGDSAIVRFYFTDAETETLINATGCNSCSKPGTAYDLGVTKYNNNDDSKENGTLADNAGGVYSYLNRSKVRIVPFDIGYYAEFKVKDFSEFWLNNGGINNNVPLPVKLLNFTARKQGGDAVLNWKTTDEYNLDHYEVEVARGNQDYLLNRFSSLGSVTSRGGSSAEQDYGFTDREAGKNGVRYYRLKMVDTNGEFRFSSIRPLLFTDDLQWQVYPNPSGGLFYFVFQGQEGQTLQLKVYNLEGKVVKNLSVHSTGFQQKQAVDLSAADLPAGLYMLEATDAGRKQYFRIIKQ